MAKQSGLIPIGQAARLLMISEERIRQLQKQGYIPRADKRGVVQLVGAVQGYLRYLKDVGEVGRRQLAPGMKRHLLRAIIGQR